MIAEVKEISAVVRKDVILTMTYDEAKLLVKFMGSIRPCDGSRLTEGACTVQEVGNLTQWVYDSLTNKGVSIY